MKNSNQIFYGFVIIALAIIGSVLYANYNSGDSDQAQASAGGSHMARSNSGDMSGHHSSQPSTASEIKDLVDKPAPDFSLADKDGNTLRLSELKGKTVVLFFNEGLMCYPSCWNQMVQLSSDPRLNSESVASYSIVVDSASNWGTAVAKMPKLAGAKVLFDTDKNVSSSLGMLATPSSMHKGAYPGHSYVVIDAAGVVRFVYDDPRMGINNDLISEKVDAIRSNQ
ncbi:MAG TPA: redoxin domain-containing protein [Candidatus Paceibacterota bacterium]|nr:redoxin domain-containing protein [Candidatus Paceibacterota bacterium]